MRVERSDRTVYLRVLGPLAVATITLVVLSVGGFHALTAARAYVGGESLWSKARSQAINRLRAEPASACGNVDAMLEIPLGDRAARLALDADPPRLDEARAGFVRGGNSPDDVDAMIHLYLNFQVLPPMREAIATWARGDLLIDELRGLAQRICAQTRTDDNGPAAMAPLLRQLDRLDGALIEAESHFSRALGRASRITETALTFGTLVLALGLAGAGAWFVFTSLRSKFAQQRDLLEANRRWDLAAEAAHIGLFDWQPQNNLLQLDARARALYGLDPNPDVPVDRDSVLALIDPEDRERLVSASLDAVQGEPMLRARYRVHALDGRQRHIESIGVMRDSRMFGLLRDVTDEVTRERLRLDKEAAERSTRARTEFLSRLSHELRTPLNAILGLAQVIELDPQEPLRPRQAQRLKLLLESGWHLLHLVDDVLDITSIDSGMLAMRPAPTDLRAVVETSLALVEPERKAFGIEVHNRLPAQLPQVLADPRRLQQVLVNLFSNGCKYNRPGGRLTIECRDEPQQQVCLDVSDEGAGLTPQQLGELFQPFKRLTQAAEIPGTGLGLTVVKMLVAQMGGTIEVASEPGAGCRFTVCLRRVEAPADRDVETTV